MEGAGTRALGGGTRGRGGNRGLGRREIPGGRGGPDAITPIDEGEALDGEPFAVVGGTPEEHGEGSAVGAGAPAQ